MKSNVAYKKSVAKDLKGIDYHQRKRIQDQIDSDLAHNPTAGERLSGEYKGLFKYRVGDYRIIYTLIKNDILILRIGHRKEVYR